LNGGRGEGGEEEEEEEEEGLFKAVNEVDAESDGDASVGGDEIRR
jgi:hypothetical protein